MDQRLVDLSKEAFAFLAELASSGHVEAVGLPDSPRRIELLMRQVLQESLNILRHEDETVSLEQLGGRGAVIRLVDLVNAARQLPDGQRPELEPTLSQTINQNRGRTRAALTARRKEPPM